MFEKSPPPPSTERTVWLRGAVAGSLAVAAVVTIYSPAHEPADELPFRQVFGTTEIRYSDYGARTVTDLTAAEGTPPVVSYCRGDEMLIIQRQPPPAGLSVWEQLKAYETGAIVIPHHPYCDDGLLVPSEYGASN